MIQWFPNKGVSYVNIFKELSPYKWPKFTVQPNTLVVREPKDLSGHINWKRIERDLSRGTGLTKEEVFLTILTIVFAVILTAFWAYSSTFLIIVIVGIIVEKIQGTRH